MFVVVIEFFFFFFFQAEDGIRDLTVTGVQTCALPILSEAGHIRADERLAEEDWREACSPKDRHLAGVEHLQLVECSAIAVTLVRPELEIARCRSTSAG